MDILPDEITIEVFHRIGFFESHRNLRLVCQRWNKLITNHYAYPYKIHVTELMKIQTIEKLVKKFSHKVFALEICNVSDIRVLQILEMNSWANLRILCMRTKLTKYASLCTISVDFIVKVIKSSPKLFNVEIHECYIHGNIDVFVQTLLIRKIRRFTLLNKYIFVDQSEKFYNLTNMQVFRLSDCGSGTNILSNKTHEFSSNNNFSLEYLSLRFSIPHHEKLIFTPNDFVTHELASFNKLIKLDLLGQVNLTYSGLMKITKLSNLRELKIEISVIPKKAFTQFLKLEFAQKLSGLQISWNRAVSREEIEQLLMLPKIMYLSVKFQGPIYSRITADFSTLINTKRKLIKLKICSSHLIFLKLLSLLKSKISGISVLKLKFYSDENLYASFKNSALTEFPLQSLNLYYQYDLKCAAGVTEIVLRKKF